MTSRSGSSNLNLASPLARLSHPLSGLRPHEGQSESAAWTSEYSVRCGTWVRLDQQLVLLNSCRLIKTLSGLLCKERALT